MRRLILAMLGFFPCRHVRLSFPMTRAKKETYRVCLECGREFAYSWKEMRILDARESGSKG